MSDLIRRSDAVKALASQLAMNAEMRTAEEHPWEDFKDAFQLATKLPLRDFKDAAEWILAKCETVDPIKILEERRKALVTMDMAGAEHVLVKHAIDPLREILEEDDETD